MKEIILPANIIVSGATMCGKTFLVSNLLKEQLLNQVDYLIFFSPTIKISRDFEDFQENYNMANSNKPPSTIIKKYHNNFTNNIKEIITSQETLFKMETDKDKKKLPKILFVLDDMVNDKALRYRGVIDNFSTKARHLNISIICLVQRISAIPKTFRLNAKYVFFFSAVNFKELETILEQYCSKKYISDVRKEIHYIFDEKYNFILAENFNPIQKERLLKNGQEKIIK